MFNLILVLILIILYYLLIFKKKQNIWMYWENKINTKKPAYIELCYNTVLKHCKKDFNICYLNEKTIHKYLPNLRKDLNHLSIPKKTDYYRLKLLYKYGGIWIDADTIIFDTLKPLISKLKYFDFVGFGCHKIKDCPISGHPKPSNGVLVSRKNTLFIKKCIDNCDNILNQNKKIKYFDLGRKVLWRNIKELEKTGWKYFHYDSICIERDSKNKKYKNKRLISNEDIDQKCKNKLLFVPIYNTAPGFPDWFKSKTKKEILNDNLLISKLFNLSLYNK